MVTCGLVTRIIIFTSVIRYAGLKKAWCSGQVNLPQANGSVAKQTLPNSTTYAQIASIIVRKIQNSTMILAGKF